jgi:hypothetical protein
MIPKLVEDEPKCGPGVPNGSHARRPDPLWARMMFGNRCCNNML